MLAIVPKNRNTENEYIQVWGQTITLIEYSSELSDMAEADELYQSYDLQQNDWLTPDIVSSFGGC